MPYSDKILPRWHVLSKIPQISIATVFLHKPNSEQTSAAFSIKTIAEGMRGRAVCQSRSPRIEFDSRTTNDDRAKTQIWKQMRSAWEAREGSGRVYWISGGAREEGGDINISRKWTPEGDFLFLGCESVSFMMIR